jgi:hypothetical protein
MPWTPVPSGWVPLGRVAAGQDRDHRRYRRRSERIPRTRHPNPGSRSAAARNDTHGSENTTGGQRRGDPAGQPVAFFVAAHVREHSLTLVLQQPALNTGILAPEMASSHAVTVFARDRDTPWAC